MALGLPATTYLLNLIFSGLITMPRTPSPGKLSPTRPTRPKTPTKTTSKSPTRKKSKDRTNQDRDLPELPYGPGQTPTTDQFCESLDFSRLSDIEVKRLMLHQLCSINKSLQIIAGQRSQTNIYTVPLNCYPTSTL